MIIVDIWRNPFFRNSNQITSVTEEVLKPADYVEFIHSHCDIDPNNLIEISIIQGKVFVKANKELILDYYRRLFPQYAHFRDDNSDIYITGQPLWHYAEKNSPIYCITLYGEGAFELQASIIIKAPIEGVVTHWHYDQQYGDEWNKHDSLFHITPFNLVKESDLCFFPTKYNSECNIPFIGYKYYNNFYRDIINNHNESGSVSIKWLVKDGEYVSEQQTIAIIECNRQTNDKRLFEVKSFSEGIIFIDMRRTIFGRNKSDFPGPAFYSLYKGHKEVINKRYHNYSEKEVDPFIQSCNIFYVKPWIVNGRYYDEGERDRFRAFEMCSSSGVSLYISLIVEHDIPMIVFSADDAKLSLKAGDMISLLMKKNLFDDGTILYFELEKECFPYPSTFHNLYNLSYSSTLFKDDLKVLTKLYCYGWKYINSERTIVQIGGNYNNWCSQEYAPESFRSYASGFFWQIEYVNDIILRDKYIFRQDVSEFRIGLLQKKENAEYRVTSITKEIAQMLKNEIIELACLKEYPSKDIANSVEKKLQETFFATCEKGMWKSLCVAELEAIIKVLDGYINSEWLKRNPYIETP